MTTPLATPGDVVARLGRDLTDSEVIRLGALLADASARVRRYCDGQQFTQATTTERLAISNGVVRLPQRPVTAVNSVTVVGGAGVAYRWNGLDLIAMCVSPFDGFAVEPWITPPSVVDVNYTHGYTTIPDDIIGVVCSVVLRAVGRTPTEGGITSETIMGYSYSVGVIGAAGAMGLLPDEQAVLEPYRRPVGVARTDVASMNVPSYFRY